MPIRVPITPDDPRMQQFFRGSSTPGAGPSSSPFGEQPPTLFSSSSSQARTDAFRKLKPVCVPLMGIQVLTPSDHNKNLNLLSALRTTLESLPSSSLDDLFTLSLINYVTFPLTHILQRNDPSTMSERILEEIFLSLAFLVERWKRTDEGMEMKAWEQLWILAVVVLGGAPTSKQPKEQLSEKGKKKELSDEGQLACVKLLQALLSPYESEEAMSQPHPSQQMVDLVFSAPAKTSILFHTISSLLDLVIPPLSSIPIPLSISSLSLLKDLVRKYLRGRIEMLASIMPGVVSTVVKMIQGEGKLLKGDVAQAGCELLGEVIVITVGDEELVDKGIIKEQVTRLDQLGEDKDIPDPTTSDQSQAFPALNTQYLAYTQTQLLSSLRVLVPALQSHSNPTTRTSLATLCFRILQKCRLSLPLLPTHLLSTLLNLSQDTFDDVRYEARRSIRVLLEDKAIAADFLPRLKKILEDTLAGFPRRITSHSITQVEESTNILTALAELSEATSSGMFGSLLGPNGGVEKWSLGLLECLELGSNSIARPGMNMAGRAWQMAQGHLDWNGPSLLLGGVEGDTKTASGPETRDFPAIHLRFIESAETTKLIGNMLEAVGKAAEDESIHSIEYLLGVARAKRNGVEVAKAASALWLADRLLIGLAMSEKSSQKRARKVARLVVDLLVRFDEDEEDWEVDEEEEAENETSDALIPVERTQGIQTVSHLLKRNGNPKATSSSRAETRRLHLQAHRTLVTSVSLSLMATSARILESAFRPLLLSSLYLLLSHLASPDPVIVSFAEVAIIKVSYLAGYASPQNLVMDNVDYVINIVSQRLVYKRLSPLAPMVLISMIRLVGEPIVPLVHDIVDDIFDALDDFHGYELLSSTLLAVLDTLMKAMVNDMDLDNWSPKPSTSFRLRPAPDPERDLELFVEWHGKRLERARTALDEILEQAPQKPWKEGDEEEEEPPIAPKDEPEVPPTRAQEVCKQVLDKAVHYLTHSSPFIRARVLSLLASGVPVLVVGDREGDFLPVIHKAWPYILNRLKDPQPYVVTEAAALLEALAKYVGDFMSKRILDHAWPTLKVLLETQKKLDERSALVKRGGDRSSDHSISHRLHLSIIGVMRYIVQEVPISDALLWEMILAFRPFLDVEGHEAIQNGAVELYRKMVSRDEDAVWLALKAAIGEAGDGVSYLRQPGLSIKSNVDQVLK